MPGSFWGYACGGNEAQITGAQEQALTYMAHAVDWTSFDPDKFWRLWASPDMQASLFFDEHPDLSGWRDTAAEWSKIP